MRRVPALLFAPLTVATFGWTPSAAATAAILAGSAAVSMPHGAFDIVTGPRIAGRWFSAGYLLLAGSTIAVWFLAPAIAVTLFVAMAWWHFGRGDASHIAGTRLARVAHGTASGGAVLAAALWIHTDHIAATAEHLALGRVPFSATQLHITGATLAAIVALTGTVAFVAHLANRRVWHAAELATLGVLAVVAHPVVSFAAYFVGVHSLRHLAELDARFTSRHDRWSVIGASAAPVVLGSIVIAVNPASDAVVIQVAVIGLAALTTPHLLLTDAHRQLEIRRTQPLPTPRSAGLTDTRRQAKRESPVGSLLQL